MRALRNTFYLYLSLLGTMVFGFIQLKILTAFLGKEEVGLFFAASGISLLLTTLSQLGFPLVYARFVPKYEAEDKKGKGKRLLAFSLSTYTMLSLPFWLVILVLSLFFRGEGLLRALLYAYPAYFLYSLLGLLLSYFVGERRMHLTALYNLTALFLFNLLLFLLRHHLTVKLVFIALFGVSLPMVAVVIAAARPSFKSLKEIRREIQPFWSFAILGSFLTPLFMYIDRALIPAFLPLSALAVFSVARRIETSARRMLGVPLSSIAPEVSYYWERGGELREGFRSSFRAFVKIYLYLVVLFVSLLILLSKPLILLISSREYLSAHVYLAILLVGGTPAALYTPYTMVARSLGRMDLFFAGDLIWIVTFGVSFVPLVHLLGLTGVALSFAIAHIITLFYVFLIVNPRTIGIPVDLKYSTAMYGGLLIFLLLFYRQGYLPGALILILLLVMGFVLLKGDERKRLRAFLGSAQEPPTSTTMREKSP